MSPLFSCAGCGVQIERSLRHYLQQKGRVLCSTCLDRQEAERQQAELKQAELTQAEVRQPERGEPPQPETAGEGAPQNGGRP
ncbi:MULTISPECIES: hypothetical protein [Aphanothece]|uniref:hypothetical protein n=1 Tax=Aphanothece TaxID=1121 RepID=UPI003984A1E5